MTQDEKYTKEFEKALNDYIKLGFNQDECNGFMHGFHKGAEAKQLILSGVMHLLPDANKLYKMAETIVSKPVMILNTPENKQIDWEELKNNWFDWLNEEIKGNCA